MASLSEANPAAFAGSAASDYLALLQELASQPAAAAYLAAHGILGHCVSLMVQLLLLLFDNESGLSPSDAQALTQGIGASVRQTQSLGSYRDAGRHKH